MGLQTTVKCNKTLKHADGSTSFIKGNTYTGNICNVLENLKVKNEQGEDHCLGHWAKHFTNISKY
jgi:hypothetical protein